MLDQAIRVPGSTVASPDQSAESSEQFCAGDFAPFKGDGFDSCDNDTRGFHASEALLMIDRLSAADSIGGYEDGDAL